MKQTATMKFPTQLLGALGAVLLIPASAQAFSLIGPPIDWQNTAVQMNLAGDVGTPQVITEEYRYNVPVVYYAPDATFVDYFGARGLEELDKAARIFNDLPRASQMSGDLSEFPLDTSRLNYKAASLGLLDLKSTILSFMVEQLGLLEPTRYVWCLRGFVPDQNCSQNSIATYLIIKRNYDPITWEPSSYINGTLYTFRLILGNNCAFGDAVEEVVDPIAIPDNTVADLTLRYGRFFSGLTRDDIGGLRYLLRPNNFNPNETLPGATILGGSPFAPFDPNAVPVTPPPSVRGGIDKVKFEKRNFDSLLGNFFQPFTNYFQATIVTNGIAIQEYYSRPVLRPDLVLSAADLGTTATPTPVLVTRIVPPYATQNQGTSVAGTINGPGSLDISAAQVGFALSKVGPSWLGQTPVLIRETQATFVYNWGTFDGSTNEPVIYPSSASVLDLERLIFDN